MASKHIFGYPGGAVLPIYDELFQQEEVEHILVRHEQGAGHAAEGYARSTGKPGVVLVTSGPGATNMVTPLTDALMDFDPAGCCITGQVPTHLIATTRSRNATPSASPGPAPSSNWLCADVNDLAKVLHEAFYVAVTGRPGPVVVDVPKTCSSRSAPIIRRASPMCMCPMRRGSRATRRRSAKPWHCWPGPPPGDLQRRRRHQFRHRGLQAAARTGRSHRFSDHLNPDGLGAYRRRARTGSACSACTARTRLTWRCRIATSCCASGAVR